MSDHRPVTAGSENRTILRLLRGARDADGVLDLLALEVAGIADARLYPGSYSEWSNDPELPVATG